MAQVDFFASDDDFIDLVDWLLTETDFKIFEAYSRIDHDIRQIVTAKDLVDLANERKNSSFLLRFWSPSVTNEPVFKSIKLNPNIGKFRTSLEGAGVIQLEHGRVENNRIFNSTLSHWNEAGAKAKCMYPTDVVDWKKLRSISGQLNRHIKNKLAHAKVGSAPVLKGAIKQIDSGLPLWYCGKEITKADLDLGT
ncbi:hypothetical protein [Pseudoalteromonas phenolica]|uniref:Uncharacterized protein n=1 Tax=Pseudoalteromonas phenolica TaxID=161398 RepID=A0A0S2K3Z3_9GAMM|nr:hypothetical protein [Pseudoalteromonas phenolica]ALO42788.1 hypothetical protein PP2015_2291 [Pseudoalteromonas phenolica]MBE0356079.1 hypothetical protein [Pseudoalteromonas phenolica O-BC30]RXE99672.1 hypothetical protein D9981_09855 [Pseudoalteromonas phenolica O-BC30]